MSGATVGSGRGVAVPVGGGGTSGVNVTDGVPVGPIAIGMPLQAVSTRASKSPKKLRMRFMRVLILVNKGGVNGFFGVKKAVFTKVICENFHYTTIAIEFVRILCKIT
jgi:hypothetical protein